MDERVYPYTCTSDGSGYLGFLPPENTSGHPSTEAGATLASDSRTFPHQGLLLYERQMSSWQPLLHAYTHNLRANAEVLHPTGCHPSMQSTVIPGPMMLHPRNFPSYPEGFPSDCPSDLLCQTTLSTPAPHAPPKDPSHQYDLPLPHSPSFRPQPSSPNYFRPSPDAMLQCQSPPTRVQSTTPDFSCDQPQRSWELGGGPTTAFSPWHPASSSQLASTCAAPERRFSCKDCGKGYTQPQGLSRHRREMHERRPCIYCLDFKWGRRYILKKHLKKQHPELNTDAALDEATGTRRGATIGSNPTGFNCR